MSILELENVYYTYRNKYRSVEALHGISCSFEQGKTYAIIGKSGSGKSTMLSLMAGLDLPEKGSVLFNGVPTNKIPSDKYRRNSASVIYQNFRLFPLMTALENVMYPMELKKAPEKQAAEKAKELIISVGLSESVFNRFPSMLSGGEQQRVAIARALAMDTQLILADEPTGNLDTASSENIIKILCSLAHDKNYCVIIITHDMEILKYTDGIYKMNDGILSPADDLL